MSNLFKKELEARRAQLRRSNRNFPVDRIIPVPLPDDDGVVKNRIAAFRSRDYLVQVFQEEGGLIRLSVNRSDIDKAGDWLDGISWDSLQVIKSQCGFGDCDAVEVYPPNKDVVCDYNVRHLWIFPPASPLPFVWRKKTDDQQSTTRPEGQPGDESSIIQLEQPGGQNDPNAEEIHSGAEGQPGETPDELPEVSHALNTLRNLRKL